MSTYPKNILGLRFGRLKVIDGPKQFAGGEGYYWLTHCDCGNRPWIRVDSLLQNKTRSCGCLRSELGRARIREVHQARRDRFKAERA